MPARQLGQYRGPLTPDQIAEGMNAARRNAKRLARDAELLLAEDRAPSALALALLSIEESGKISILRGLPVAGPEGLKESWREYRSHTRKNVMGGLLDEVANGARKLDDFLSLFSKDAEHPQVLNQLKQVALYTDCLGDAHWSVPEEVVEPPLASQLVQLALVLAGREVDTTPTEIELWIKHLGPVWKQDPAWMRQALQNWYDDMQRHGLAPEGPNAMTRFIKEGVGTDQADE